MYPVKLTPAFKDYIWGGKKLVRDFNKKCDLDKVSESWELSCHKDGNSIIAEGADKGLTFAQFIEKNGGKSLLGTNAERFEYFPILIKLIDACDNLSIQVHPDNDYALRVEGEYGKTEMWYIVDCDEGASLYYGFDHEISKEEFERRIADNTLPEVLNCVPVKKGDVFFIEAGTLHAICKGIVICEIQQNSNTTYRIFDYNRKGKDGNPRPLHVKKALDVTHLCPPSRPAKPEGEPVRDDNIIHTLLAKSDYFITTKLEFDGEGVRYAFEESFVSLICIEGEGSICVGDTKIDFIKGDSIFVPAAAGKIEFTCKNATFIETRV